MNTQADNIIPHVSSVLRKWLISRKLNPTYSLCGSLSKILETPALSKNPIFPDSSTPSTTKIQGKDYKEVCSSLNSTNLGLKSSLSDKHHSGILHIQETCDEIEVSVCKLSLTSRSSSLDGQGWNSLSALLTACGQSVPSSIADMLLSYWFVSLSLYY